MEPIGVVLLDMPRMLREIIKSVIRLEPDMRLLGEFPASADLIETVQSTGARLVITDTRTAACEQVPRLLRAEPRVRVLGIANDGLESDLYELRPHRVRLGEVSPESLVQTIRARPPLHVIEHSG